MRNQVKRSHSQLSFSTPPPALPAEVWSTSVLPPQLPALHKSVCADSPLFSPEASVFVHVAAS